MSKQSDLVRLLDSSGAVVADALTNAPNPITAGTIAYIGVSSAPSGWLKANGAAVSRTTYADLFTAIGTTFGSGDGSTTFNLPDLRAEFVRGLDDGRAVDSGRTLGSAQLDAFKSHTHSIAAHSAAGNGTYITSSAGYSRVNETIGSGGGTTETRPRNVALLACIKY